MLLQSLYFSRPLPPPPSPRAIISDARPSVHLKIKIAVAVRRGISKRSHKKIGDCEQSMFDVFIENTGALREDNLFLWRRRVSYLP